MTNITICSSCLGARNLYDSLVSQFSGSEGTDVAVGYSQGCIRGCGLGSRVDLTRDGSVVRYAATPHVSATFLIKPLTCLVEDAKRQSA